MSENLTEAKVWLTLLQTRLQLITLDAESSETWLIYYLYPEIDIL